ncbi:MAG: 2-oxoacid:acceptor oxidoreductase family protein [Campylobacterota bacterium]
MRYQVVIAGFGGQGAVFLVKLLALCAGNKGIKCLGTENHGMSQRGGAVSCFIKLGEFANPVIDPHQADLLIGLEENEALRNLSYLSDNARMVVNGTGVDQKDIYCNLTQIDAFAKAKQGAFPIQGLNVYMLGVAMAKEHAFPFSLEEVKQALRDFNAKIADQNIEVLMQGYNDAK